MEVQDTFFHGSGRETLRSVGDRIGAVTAQIQRNGWPLPPFTHTRGRALLP